MKLSELIDYIDGKLICGDLNKQIKDIKIDSRKVDKDDTFIGIKGENFDGNMFYLDALDNGASIIILDNEEIITKKEKTIILVKDSIKALQDIARYKMSKIDIPVIAVTGSVGKTTTKDLIYNVLSTKYKVLKTDKNYNGQIGLPLTVMNLQDEEILLVEMGMNEKGGIDKLSKIVEPDIAVITNIGTSHIGNLGSRKNIMKAKLEILNHMKDNSTLIINNDDLLLHKQIKKLKKYDVITYGIKNKSDYNAHDINLEENKTIYYLDNKKYQLNLIGLSSVYNSLVSIIIGKLFNIKKIKFNNLSITNNRLEIINKNNIKIIDDSYNASYESILNALDTLNIIGKDRKIVVLGDVLELGKYSKKIHEEIGKNIKDIDILITIGKYSKYIYNKAIIKNKYHFNTNEEALNKLKELIKEKDTILIKASHYMNFKYIVDNLIN